MPENFDGVPEAVVPEPKETGPKRPITPELYKQLEYYRSPQDNPKVTPELTDDALRSFAAPYKEFFKAVRTYQQEKRLETGAVSTPKEGVRDFRATTAIHFARMVAQRYGIQLNAQISAADSIGSDQDGTVHINMQLVRDPSPSPTAAYKVAFGSGERPLLGELTKQMYETRAVNIFLEVMDEK